MEEISLYQSLSKKIPNRQLDDKRKNQMINFCKKMNYMEKDQMLGLIFEYFLRKSNGEEDSFEDIFPFSLSFERGSLFLWTNYPTTF